MIRIALLSPSLTTADAVSNDVVGMYEVLKKSRCEVRIYSETAALNGYKVYPFSRIKRFLNQPRDILIYHYSVGWEQGLALLREINCRKVIKYHNVTPPQFFTGFSASDEYLCVTGRKHLKELATINCDLYLSASPYSMRELIEEGASSERSLVVPPFHHVDRMHAIKPDADVLEKYTDGKTNILMVGRVSPHKGHLALLEAFATYYYRYNDNARLIVVGKGGEGLSSYSVLLRRAVASLSLEKAVVFTGGVPDAALKAYYLISDAFMMASEHEGFCVPLVESMAMKLPIVAYASTAIPETVGDAGLVWEERDPYLLAQSLDVIVKDKAVNQALREKGLRRYEQMYTNERIGDEFLRALDALL
ncbi:MAG TPA: glycosyltransferase family 4 protein [Pyrinomonadaceae bacterium]|jgi:glycosyltransferase involved in cell wall biosynthesis|nr:glycosyltransferase family 4 protein [Pyrinomonadaceae bacterium]